MSETTAGTIGSKSGDADVDSGIRSLDEWLARAAERRPFELVLAAAGVGFVLGGGLAVPAVRALLFMGVRDAVLNGAGSPVRLWREAMAAAAAKRSDPS